MCPINEALFSSDSGEWETPLSLFDECNAMFNFTLDAAASDKNFKCTPYFTKEDDALTKPWNGRVWLNPPYGRTVGKWVGKAAYEAEYNPECELVVCLLPVRTDTKWFHDYCKHAKAIGFLKGRLKFGDATNSAPFPSMLVVFSRE